ncbi:Putative morphogenetic protein (fragment) [Pantoea brenneri]|uniref:Morphogenetic protein n=1 Tax=Pantoea brenneri TaxID=472694 RepID=A0AAX3JC57_9GAMM
MFHDFHLNGWLTIIDNLTLTARQPVGDVDALPLWRAIQMNNTLTEQMRKTNNRSE